MGIRFQNAEFCLSAATPAQFIRDGAPQLVFAGRSNVGKSSVINRLTGRKNLARVGAQPGKTAQINFFRLEGKAYLVDLPGYGYAKVSKSEKERWGRLMEQYFAGGTITFGVLLVDARHEPTEDDLTMFRWFVQRGCPMAVVANKVDKVKSSEIESHLGLIRQTLNYEGPLIAFSAETGQGKDELLHILTQALS